MKRLTDLGAAYERHNHAYTNRTGRLEASTKGRLERFTRAEARADLEMLQPYASYVVRMGLSDINAARSITQHNIQDRLDAMVATISNRSTSL